jgi:glycosyltransferase involved in cell wall biosynthesis
MTILFIALGIYGRTGGIEAFNRRVVRCLAEMAAEQGSRARVIALWDESEHTRLAPAEVRFFPGACGKLRTALRFYREVLESRPDVILYGHILLAPLAPLARVLSPRSRHILFVHGSEVWGDRKFRRLLPWEPPLVRRFFDTIISVSKFTRRRMISAFSLSAQRFDVLPCAVDWPERQSTVQEPTQDKAPVILTVCRLGYKDRYKGVDKVIEAMPEILRCVPEACYWVVGAGPLRAELEQLAARCGVGDKVKFFGFVDDQSLTRLYSQAQVFIMPSTGEGFGIVFLEAWRHGLPVICGSVDASAEVVSHRMNGLLVNPESVSDIAQAAVGLLSDSNFRKQLGEQGRKTAKLYSHAAFRERLSAILNRVAPAAYRSSREHSQSSQPLPAPRR